jgi:hypothetical protein
MRRIDHEQLNLFAMQRRQKCRTCKAFGRRQDDIQSIVRDASPSPPPVPAMSARCGFARRRCLDR